VDPDPDQADRVERLDAPVCLFVLTYRFLTFEKLSEPLQTYNFFTPEEWNIYSGARC
jgi:hypothetical protein